MVRFSSRALRAAFLSAALVTVAATASAATGSFTLPFETHWDNATLPAGDYTFSTWSNSDWPKVMTISGAGKTVYILAAVEQRGENLEGSYLEIQDVNGAKVVRGFQSNAMGTTFHFDVPKELRSEKIARATPQQTSHVAVRTRQ